jgi:HAD superfamily phosphatase (TIGR01668 family)
MLNWLRPHKIIQRLDDLDCRALVEQGVRGVMLDLDNTLTHWHSHHISPAVEAWIGTLWQSGLRACMVTNAGAAHRVRPVADRLGLPWVVRACKPLAGGFQRGMRLLGTAPEETAMIGDMLFTDVLGGNRLGLMTILVEPMSIRESFCARFIHRPLENFIGRVPKSY